MSPERSVTYVSERTQQVAVSPPPLGFHSGFQNSRVVANLPPDIPALSLLRDIDCQSTGSNFISARIEVYPIEVQRLLGGIEDVPKEDEGTISTCTSLSLLIDR